MSTRAQLRFVVRGEAINDDGEKVSEIKRATQIYNHSDGYPECILPDLRRLQRVIGRRVKHEDPSYIAAMFITVGKLGTVAGLGGEELAPGDTFNEVYDPEVIAQSDVGKWLKLGYGVENVGPIHGGEEYVYIVDVSDPEWFVDVSEHNGFPRWDANDELEDTDAFEEATWQFSGSLDDGLDMFKS